MDEKNALPDGLQSITVGGTEQTKNNAVWVKEIQSAEWRRGYDEAISACARLGWKTPTSEKAAERRGYLKGVNDSLDFLESLRARFVTDEAWSTSYADMKLALKPSAGE